MTRAWRWVGERALLRAFPDPVPESNARALALASRVAVARLPEVVDIVPGARSLLVVLDTEAEPPRDLLAMLDDPETSDAPNPATNVHEIPCRYGGVDGPDLADVAGRCRLSEGDVVRLHAEPTYTVGFIGFSPGFPYLLGMRDRIAVPRLDTPRTRIPAGSVGIGGVYTGVYPQATAGGWRLIGRTDATLFDARRTPPALLAPGDTVRFVPV